MLKASEERGAYKRRTPFFFLENNMNLKAAVLKEWRLWVLSGTQMRGYNVVYLDALTAIEMMMEKWLMVTDGDGQLLYASWADLPSAMSGDMFCFFISMNEVSYANSKDDPEYGATGTACPTCGHVL